MTKIIDKLVGLLDQPELQVADIRFAVRHDELATLEFSAREYKRLTRLICAALRTLDSIPPALQVDCVCLYDGATRAIGELLHPTAQEAVLDQFPGDLPILVRNAPKYGAISEALWRKLGGLVKRGDLTALRVLKKLTIRADCPANILKLAGATVESSAKARVKSAVQTNRPVRKTVKTDFENDYDFEDVAPIKQAARNVRRPSV